MIELKLWRCEVTRNVRDCREMLKTDPTTVHCKVNSAKTTADIKLKFCVLAEGCLGSIYCEFYQILRWSSGDHLLNWHGMTLHLHLYVCMYSFLCLYSRVNSSTYCKFNGSITEGTTPQIC